MVILSTDVTGGAIYVRPNQKYKYWDSERQGNIKFNRIRLSHNHFGPSISIATQHTDTPSSQPPPTENHTLEYTDGMQKKH